MQISSFLLHPTERHNTGQQGRRSNKRQGRKGAELWNEESKGQTDPLSSTETETIQIILPNGVPQTQLKMLCLTLPHALRLFLSLNQYTNIKSNYFCETCLKE